MSNNETTTKEVINKVSNIIPKNILLNSIKNTLISLHSNDINASVNMFLLFLRKYKKYNTIRKLLENESNIDLILKMHKNNIIDINQYIAIQMNAIEIVKIKSVYLIISTYGENILLSNGEYKISRLNVYFVGNKHKAYDLFTEYNNFSDKMHKSMREMNRRLYINTCKDDQGHMQCSPVKIRDINTIYNNYKNTIINYINNWKSLLADNKDYLNIAKHIGILLYGEPGTGKTSLVMALASYIKCDIFVLNLLDYSSNAIINYINNIKNNPDYKYKNRIPIILIEDIDILFSNRDASNDLKYKNAFNLLLQILDGVYSVPGSIIIATTNHIENLDPALIREGRFDLKVECKGLDEDEALQMINGFKVDESLLEGETYPINPAYLQAKIMKHKADIYLNRGMK